ncbi:unnamed protein product, partial [Penicillium discolor]
PLLRLRLPPQRVRRARLRVRLLRGSSRGPGAVGGAVRRLRQRRPVGHRRVHLRRGAEVGSAVQRHAPAPPRLRGPGTGPLLRAHRAVPAAVRPGQHDRGASVDPGVALPPAAPAGLRPPAQASHRVHPEGHAAPARRDEPGGGVHRGPLRAGPRRRPRSRPFHREARARAQRQGALGPPRRAGEEPEPGDRP